MRDTKPYRLLRELKTIYYFLRKAIFADGMRRTFLHKLIKKKKGLWEKRLFLKTRAHRKESEVKKD